MAQPAPARPSSRPRGTTSAQRLPLLASAADGRVPRSSATARWDRPVRLVFHLESEPVASRIQQPRAIRANKSGFCPIAILYIPPEAPLAPQVIPSRSHRAEFAKAAAEIRRIFNPPLQCVPSRASSLPSFGFGLRSRRSSPFVLSSSLCFPKLRRTILQGRRPPSSVAGPPELLPDDVLALGEFALSSTTPRCLRFSFSCPKSRTPRAPANSGHGAAAPCSTPAAGFPSPTPI